MQNRSKFMICKWRSDHWPNFFLRLIKLYILNLTWSPKSKLKNSHRTTTTRSIPATLRYGSCLGETQSESGELCGCSTCRFVLQIGFHQSRPKLYEHKVSESGLGCAAVWWTMLASDQRMIWFHYWPSSWWGDVINQICLAVYDWLILQF